MAWRDTLLRYFGPGLLGGITAGDWVKLLRDNHFAVAPSGILRALAISSHSLQNSVYRWYEHRRYDPRLDVAVQPPLFLLGHWRNGTTHLHNLMTVDERFAFANNYQTFFPHSFLCTEVFASRLLAFLLPKRRPMDNIEWDIHRNPYAVFQSSKWTFQVNYELHRLQRTRPDHLDEWILRQYRAMYAVFLAERRLIPEGHFVELGYEELEKDPLGLVRRVYEGLGLPDFGIVEPALRRYIDSIASYKKNTFPDLPPATRQRIAEEWRPCFEEWGYPV